MPRHALADQPGETHVVGQQDRLRGLVMFGLRQQIGGDIAGIGGASWRDYGAIILVKSLAEAVPLVDRLAPEHLEIIARDQEALSGAIRNAGEIFLGSYTPEAIGDYVGGSNHVLPTSRSARFSSGLGVYDFVKRTSILSCDAESLKALGRHAVALGEAEGLDAHARSVGLRLNLP